MKKVGSVLFICMLLMSGCTQKETVKDTKSMTLDITIQDEISNVEVFHKEVSVSGKIETLADFLAKAKELQVVMKEDQYGMTIFGMKGLETKDFSKGPWWVYESKNNNSCLEKGMCDAPSSLKIEDQDQFTFKYTTSF